MNRSAILIGTLLLATGLRMHAATIGPFEADRVVFIGDSITHAGHYVSVIEARLR